MKNTIKALEELKKKKIIEDYAIGGGIATVFYTEPFVTDDLDIFVIAKRDESKKMIDLTPIFKYFTNKGYAWKGEHIEVEGFPVHIFSVNELEEEAVKNAKVTKYEGVNTKVLTPEYLVAILLRAGRSKDKEKILKLFEQTKINKKKLKDIFKRYKLIEKYNKVKEQLL